MRLHQTKIFCIAKETSTKRTGGLLNEKIFVNDIPNKELISKIHIETIQLDIKKEKQVDWKISRGSE